MYKTNEVFLNVSTYAITCITGFGKRFHKPFIRPLSLNCNQMNHRYVHHIHRSIASHSTFKKNETFSRLKDKSLLNYVTDTHLKLKALPCSADIATDSIHWR